MSNLFDDTLRWIFTPIGSQVQATEDSQKIMDLNKVLLDRGSISQAEYDRRNGLVTGALQDQLSYNITGLDPAYQFGLGWSEGAQNIKDTVGGTINSAAKTVWSIIPWQVWAIAGVVVLVYLLPFILPRR